MSHIDRPAEAPRVEGRVLVRDDAPNGVAQLEHSRARELLSDDMDGTLSPSDQEHVHEHLDTCEGCRAFRNTLDKLVDITAHFPAPRLPDEAKQRILNQLLEESSTRS